MNDAEQILRESEVRLVATLRQRVAELEAWDQVWRDIARARDRGHHDRMMRVPIEANPYPEPANVEEGSSERAWWERSWRETDAILEHDAVKQRVAELEAERDQLKAENAEYWRAATALMNATDDNPEVERQALNNLNSIRTGNSYACMGPSVAEWLAKERDRAQAELTELRAACQPFLERGIPSNWPGECVLTFRGLWDETEGKRRGTYVSYLPIQDQGAPTIADWRRLAELVPADKADLYAAFQRRLAEDGGVWPETTGDGR